MDENLSTCDIFHTQGLHSYHNQDSLACHMLGSIFNGIDAAERLEKLKFSYLNEKIIIIIKKLNIFYFSYNKIRNR